MWHVFVIVQWHTTRANPTRFSVTLGSHIFQISKILVVLVIYIEEKCNIYHDGR